MSNTERRVWYRLRRRSVDGYRFRRQVPIGPYFADFACLSERLIVEIDGSAHDDEERDRRKTEYLEKKGFRVLRFPASYVDTELSELVESVRIALGEPPP